MRIAFACLMFLYTGVSAQSYLDSVKWNLYNNNAVSDSTFCGKGSDQRIGSGIVNLSYVNNYQKITKPATGWTNSFPGGVMNSPDSQYIQFPYSVRNYFPVACSTGVGNCYDYCGFLTQQLRLKAYRSATGNNVVMKVHEVLSNGLYLDVGDITVSSTDPLQPTIVEIPLYYGSMDYIGLRLYPLQGDDFYIKEVSIAGQRAASLPVRFISFTGNERNSSVDLQWTVDLNATTDSFVIQRSDNGFDFYTIDALPFVPGQHIYKWTDRNPVDENYYRIQAVEKSGSSTFTNIIRVTSVKSDDLSVSPNPVTGNQVTLRSKQLTPGLYVIKLIDEAGRIVSASNSMCNQTGFMKISLPSWKSGVYILSVNNNNVNVKQRIVVK